METSTSKLKTHRKPVCFILHGFNIRDGGEKTTGKLLQVIHDLGYQPKEFEYGWLGFAGARLFSNNLARVLARISEPGDIAIGHSNGCNIINQALRHGAHFERVLYVAPALDSGTPLPAQVQEAIVLHSNHDWIVWLASFLPFHPWGRMGYSGYRGPDERYRNIDCTNWSFGHSDYFRPHNLSRLTYFIARYLDENGTCDFYPTPCSKRMR